MSICIHGLFEENCPHCRVIKLTKPSQQLVELAPTEIPMEIPSKNMLGKAKDLEMTELFADAGQKLRIPQKPERIFDLRSKILETSNDPTIFTEQQERFIEKRKKENKAIYEQAVINVKKMYY